MIGIDTTPLRDKGDHIRIMTWNCNRATRVSAIWEYFRELDPDVAVLQEVSSLPTSLGRDYEVRLSREVSKDGSAGQSSSALLVRGSIGKALTLRGSQPWITRELKRFSGNLPAYEIELALGERLNIVGVYSPYWHFTHLGEVDISPVKLKHNAKVWLANLLYDALKNADLSLPWVVAGDFNFSETFDYWTSKPRGNREYLDNMAALGLTECLRKAEGKLTPTFRNTSGGKVTAQIDHLWVNESVATGLVSCATGDPKSVFGARPRQLSDHLPIVCDVTLPRSGTAKALHPVPAGVSKSGS